MFRFPRCLLMVLRTLVLTLGLGSAVLAHAGVVVIAHPNVRKLDLQTVQRIYTGRVIEVDGVPVVPLHAPAGHALRQRFLADYLQQTEDGYTAYWTVRRYVGKGCPARGVAAARPAAGGGQHPGGDCLCGRGRRAGWRPHRPAPLSACRIHRPTASR